jgi:hypothetical protein
VRSDESAARPESIPVNGARTRKEVTTMATTQANPADVIPAHPGGPDGQADASAQEVANVPMWEYVIAARLRTAGAARP